MPSLVVFAMNRHRETDFKYKNMMLKPADVAEYSLGIVSYKGCGKYHDELYFPYVDVHEHPSVLQPGEEAPIPPPNSTWWPVVQLKLREQLRTANAIVLCCFYQLQCTTPFCWDFFV